MPGATRTCSRGDWVSAAMKPDLAPELALHEEIPCPDKSRAESESSGSGAFRALALKVLFGGRPIGRCRYVEALQGPNRLAFWTGSRPLDVVCLTGSPR